MDKNTWIGFALIAAVIVGFSFLNRPSKEELAERKRVQDSIALVQQLEWETQQLSQQISQDLTQANANDSTAEQLANQLTAVYGAFAVSAQGQDGLVYMENELIRVAIDRRGGDLAKAELKNYKSYGDTVNPLCLFQADENELNFTLVTNNSRVLSTKNMYFEPVTTLTDSMQSTVVMRLKTDIEDCYISVKKLVKVDIPFVIHGNVTVMDDDFYVLEVVPKNENYAMRLFLNEKKEPLEYYFDISKNKVIIHNKNNFIDTSNMYFKYMILEFFLHIFLWYNVNRKAASPPSTRQRRTKMSDEQKAFEKEVEETGFYTPKLPRDKNGKVINTLTETQIITAITKFGASIKLSQI